MFRSRRKCTARGKPFDGWLRVKISRVNKMCSQQELVNKLLRCCYFVRLLHGCHPQLVDMFMFKNKYVHSWVSGFTRQPIAQLTEDPRYLRLNVFIREDVKILLFTDVNVTSSIVTLNRGPTKPWNVDLPAWKARVVTTRAGFVLNKS